MVIRKDQGFVQHGLVSLLTFALLFLSMTLTPLVALNVYEYFTISYNVTFSSSEIAEGQTFSVIITGQAVCIQDLPLSPTEAIITGRITAKHHNTETTVLLNPEYTVTINPFPYNAGDTGQSTQNLSLHFPIGSPPGEYSISGELIQAKLRAGLLFDVTDYLPSTEPMGSVTYNIPPVVPPPVVPPPETPDETGAPTTVPDLPDAPGPLPENPQTPEEPTDSGISAAFFTVSDLVAPSIELYQGNPITLTAKVSNTGGQPGGYEAVLSINGTVVETKYLLLENNASQMVSFILEELVPGQYFFSINGLSGFFTVKGAETLVPESEVPQNEAPYTSSETDEGGFPMNIIIYIGDAMLAGIVVWLVLKRHQTT